MTTAMTMTDVAAVTIITKECQRKASGIIRNKHEREKGEKGVS